MSTSLSLIPRTELSKILANHVCNGECCALLAPIWRRKTAYLKAFHQDLASLSGIPIDSVFLDLRQAPPDGAWTVASIIAHLCRCLQDTAESVPAEAGSPEKLARSLCDRDRHVVLLLSPLEAVGEDVARALIEGLAELRRLTPARQLGIIVAGSIVLNDLCDGRTAPFHQVHRYWLEPYLASEVESAWERMVAEYQLPAECRSRNEDVWNLTNGEPALMELLAAGLRDSDGTISQDVHRVANELIAAFGNAVVTEPDQAYQRWQKRGRKAYRAVQQTLEEIDNNPGWLELVGKLCVGAAIEPSHGKDDPAFCLALRQRGDDFDFANPLFERVLLAHYTPIKVADTLVLIGCWERARAYYQRAHGGQLGIFQPYHYTMTELVHCAFERVYFQEGRNEIASQTQQIAEDVLGLRTVSVLRGDRSKEYEGATALPDLRPGAPGEGGTEQPWVLLAASNDATNRFARGIDDSLATESVRASGPIDLAGGREALAATPLRRNPKQTLFIWAAARGAKISRVQQRALGELTRLCAAALDLADERTARDKEIESRAAQLADAMQAAEITLDLGPNIDKAVERILDRFRKDGFDHVMISLLNVSANVIRAVNASGDFKPLVPLTIRDMFDPTGKDTIDILAYVVKTGKPEFVTDCSDRRFRCDQYSIRTMTPPLKQMIVLPLQTDEVGLAWHKSRTFGTVQIARVPVPPNRIDRQKMEKLQRSAASELAQLLQSLWAQRLNRARAEQLEMLRKITANPRDNLDEELDHILKTVVQSLRAKWGSIRLLDSRFNCLRYRALFAPEWPAEFALRTYGIDETSTGGWVVKHKRFLYNPDTSRPGIPYQKKFDNIRSNCGVPIWLNRTVAGALVIDSEKEHGFTVDEIANLIAVAGVLSNILISRQADAVKKVCQDLAQHLATAQGLESALCEVVELARRAVQADHCSLFLRTDSASPCRLRATTSEHLRAKIGRAVYEIGEGRTGWVLEQGQTLRTPALWMEKPGLIEEHYPGLSPQARHSEYGPELDEREGPNPRIAFLGVPIKAEGEKECWGVLRCVVRFVGRPAQSFSPEKEELLRTIARELMVALALERFLRGEQETRRRVAEAWKSTAQMVVHQLANRLNPAKSFLKYAAEDLPNSPQKVREFIDRAGNIFAEALAILQDFRRYASDKPFPDVRPVVVAELLANFVTEANSRHPRLQGRVIQTGAVPTAQSRISPIAMLEVFEILVANSIMHGGKPEEELRIELGASVLPADSRVGAPATDMVRLEYRDNGVGIPEHLRSEIFTPFRSIHSEGTGLGLSIAMRYIDRQGGVIVAEENREQGGAYFAIYLPSVPKEGVL